MTAQQNAVERTGPRVLAGLVLGASMIVVLAGAGRSSEAPETPTAKVAGTVYRRLGAECDIADKAVLKRLYGNGKATPTGAVYDESTNSECTWTTKAVEVDLTVDIEDYPEGGEVAEAVDSYRYDLDRAEEGDPAHGLPKPLPGLGDEAYATYDPRSGSSRLTEVEARSGNAVIVVNVVAGRKAPDLGGEASVDRARRVTAAVLARLA